MPNYYTDQHIERCTLDGCKMPVVRGLGFNKKTKIHYLTYTDFCKKHTN